MSTILKKVRKLFTAFYVRDQSFERFVGLSPPSRKMAVSRCIVDVLQQGMTEFLKMHRVRLQSDDFFSFLSIFAKYSMPAMLSCNFRIPGHS